MFHSSKDKTNVPKTVPGRPYSREKNLCIVVGFPSAPAMGPGDFSYCLCCARLS